MRGTNTSQRGYEGVATDLPTWATTGGTNQWCRQGVATELLPWAASGGTCRQVPEAVCP